MKIKTQISKTLLNVSFHTEEKQKISYLILDCKLQILYRLKISKKLKNDPLQTSKQAIYLLAILQI